MQTLVHYVTTQKGGINCGLALGKQEMQGNIIFDKSSHFGPQLDAYNDVMWFYDAILHEFLLIFVSFCWMHFSQTKINLIVL